MLYLYVQFLLISITNFENQPNTSPFPESNDSKRGDKNKALIKERNLSLAETTQALFARVGDSSPCRGFPHDGR